MYIMCNVNIVEEISRHVSLIGVLSTVKLRYLVLDGAVEKLQDF